MNEAKPLRFCGSSLDDLRRFPEVARRRIGHQPDQVQRGVDPDDWKPLAAVGAGVREIRVRDATGAFRAVYVANFAGLVYVLHCFQKKTQRASKRDIELAARRYRDLCKELGQ